jgi:TonB-dependent starch-binding outer membrane protein SusC
MKKNRFTPQIIITWKFSVILIFMFISINFIHANDTAKVRPDQVNATALQEQVISGTVTDATTGEPLPGVNVVIEGKNKGTVTDVNGIYKIIISDPNSVLVFSFIGYLNAKLDVKGKTVFDISLSTDIKALNEVVVVGYGSIRKSDFTGSVSSIKTADINLSAPTIGQGIVGKVAGVQVSQVSGAPYASTKFRVRGVGSINASSDPLFVIDGYPTDADIFLNPNDIESIDILKDAASAAIYGSRASNGVVIITTKRGKDGNGRFSYEYKFGINQLSKKIDLLNSEQFIQLVIDARNGSYHDLVVNAGKTWDNSMYSDDNAARVAKVGNASSVSIPVDLYDFSTQTLIKPKYNTDWQDEIYRNAFVQNHNLSFSGGTDAIKYMVSGAYLDQEGIIIDTDQKRINLRANVDGKINEKLKIASNIALTSNTNHELSEGRWDHNPIMAALIYMPYLRAYDDNGNIIKYEAASFSSGYGYQSVENPVALAKEINITRKGLRGTYNVSANYQILPPLSFKANVGMQTYNEKYEYYRPTSLSSGANPPYSAAAIAAATATAQTISQTDQLAEFTLNYQKQMGKHNLSALAGYSAQKSTNDLISVTSKGFQNDRIEEITAKGADASNFSLNSGTGKSVCTLLSYFSRAMYNYDNIYYLTLSFRIDGSSRFGAQNRWGSFPSVAGAWNVSNEKFYNDFFGTSTTFKLRASWGLSGNNNIGNYNQAQVMTNPGGVVFGNNTISTAMWADNMKDEKLGWESTSQYNIGADLSLLKGRVVLIGNYFLSRTFNLLFNQSISAVSGATSILTNLKNSKIQNKGFDIQLDAKVIASHDFNLNFSGNISAYRNKVLDMGGASTIISAGAERSYKTHITEEGQPIGMFYGFKVKGIVRESDMANIALDDANYNSSKQLFPDGYILKGKPRSLSSSNSLKPGDLYFEDKNGDGVISDLDKDIIGSPHPDFTYAFVLSFNYKQFDFSSSFNGSFGNKVLDGQDYYLFNLEGSGNQYAKVANRYRSEEEPGNGSIYRASRGGTQSNSTRLSTFYLQDGSYFRCTNITLGYTLPSLSKIVKGISSVRVYASIDNAFTITKYLGYNPEVDYNSGANLTPGVDYGMYPLVRAYNVGIKMTF